MERLEQVDPIVAGVVFAGAVATDALSALYIRRSGEGKSAQAAVISAAMLLISYVLLYTAISNPAYALFECSGAAVGTYACIEIDKRKKVKHERNSI